MKYRFAIILMLVAMLLGAFNLFSWVSLYIVSFTLLIISSYIILISKKREHNYLGFWEFVKGEYDTLILLSALYLLVGKNLMPELLGSIVQFVSMITILLVLGFGKRNKHIA